MLRRLVTVAALAAFALSAPAFAAAKKTSKPAATKSTAKKGTKKKAAATPTPEAVATPEATPVAKKPAKKMDKTFIRTHRAGWQEVAVGSKVIVTRNDGSKVNGTIREVSDEEIVVGKTTIASRDLAQVFADPN
jgi:hypothetical protein